MLISNLKQHSLGAKRAQKFRKRTLKKIKINKNIYIYRIKIKQKNKKTNTPDVQWKQANDQKIKKKSQRHMGIFSHLIFNYESPKQALN